MFRSLIRTHAQAFQVHDGPDTAHFRFELRPEGIDFPRRMHQGPSDCGRQAKPAQGLPDALEPGSHAVKGRIRLPGFQRHAGKDLTHLKCHVFSPP